MLPEDRADTGTDPATPGGCGLERAKSDPTRQLFPG